MSHLLRREPRAASHETTMPRLVMTSHAPGPTPQAPGGAIFSINFVRHETLPRHVRRALTYLGLGYLACQVLLMVWLLVMAASARGEQHQLEGQLQGGLPAGAGVGALQRDMQGLHKRSQEQLAQLRAVIASQQSRVAIGTKLAAIARTLPARTWVTGLSGDREHRTLTIQAAYLIDPERPYELSIKAWIEALKADEGFRDGLKRLELQQSSRKAQGKATLIAFDLIAEWNPPAAHY